MASKACIMCHVKVLQFSCQVAVKIVRRLWPSWTLQWRKKHSSVRFIHLGQPSRGIFGTAGVSPMTSAVR